MSGALKLFGMTVTECGAAHPDVIGGAITHGGTVCRPPLPVMRIIERLEAGPTVLSAEDREHLDLIGIDVVEVTDEIRRRDGYAMLAEGKTPEAINKQIAAYEPQYRAAEPIRVTAYFRKI